MHNLYLKIKRGLKKPPKIILERLISELSQFIGQFTEPLRVKKFNKLQLLKSIGFQSLDELWHHLSINKYPAHFIVNLNNDCHNYLNSNYDNIIVLAEQTLEKKINLLGTGLIFLGDKIDWHKDYKSNIRWEPKYFRKISYSNPHDASDVKIPWEISRMQWLIPAGQAYLLTKNEKYALFTRKIIENWIEENPYSQSVNWTCTMEVAMRIFSWTWFFHVFKSSISWSDKKFQEDFLRYLFLHLEFTDRFIEKSDVNGNHFTADAAALVFGSLFFDKGKKINIWHQKGWDYLEDEIIKQIFADGVDYEASIPYHRLVTELFFYPAYYRIIKGYSVSSTYNERLEKMAMFTIAYSRPNGTIPLWGDADDARVLPFRFSSINDHRYLIGLIGIGLKKHELLKYFSGPIDELFWTFNTRILGTLHTVGKEPGTMGFNDGGFYILRDKNNHVFIDCGPIGLAGRGGHGHNDLLSFEAFLGGEHIITDCGQYVYTANYQERNYFRSTSYHNTPQINEEEINRFIRWDYLWNLENDAEHNLILFEKNNTNSIFEGKHNGYKRLNNPVIINRRFELNHHNNNLVIIDNIESKGSNKASIPFHFAPDVFIIQEVNKLKLEKNNKSYSFSWETNTMLNYSIKEARVATSYGVFKETSKLIFNLGLVNGINNIKFKICEK